MTPKLIGLTAVIEYANDDQDQSFQCEFAATPAEVEEALKGDCRAFRGLMHDVEEEMRRKRGQLKTIRVTDEHMLVCETTF